MPHLQLISLGGKLFDGDVYEVVLPTTEGDIAVYEGYAPLLTVAGKGVVMVRHKKADRDDQRDYFAIYGGTIEVLNNNINVLVDAADKPDQINEAEVREAYAKAEALVKESHDEVTLDRAQTILESQKIRLKLAELHRHRKTRI